MAKTKLKIYLSTIKKYFCSKLGIEINQDFLWVRVPGTCETQEDKENVIFDIIENLGHKIKVKKNGRKKRVGLQRG